METIEGLWAKTSSWFYGTIKFYCSIKPGGRFCPEPFNWSDSLKHTNDDRVLIQWKVV